MVHDHYVEVKKKSWDMKRSIGKQLSFMRKNVAKETGKFMNNFTKSTGKIAEDVSKSISKIDVEDLKKDLRKSTRKAVRRGNKLMIRSRKNFRKTGFYKTLQRTPVYTSRLSAWARVRFKKVKNSIRARYYTSRKWALKKYPKVQYWMGNTSGSIKSWFVVQLPIAGSFLKANAPKIENFVLTKLPVYRAVFGR